jgi:hypothetical protein
MFTRAIDLVTDPSADADILTRTCGEIARYQHDLNDPTYQAALAAWKQANSIKSRFHLYSLEEVLREPDVELPGSILPLSAAELSARTWTPRRDDE